MRGALGCRRRCRSAPADRRRPLVGPSPPLSCSDEERATVAAQLAHHKATYAVLQAGLKEAALAQRAAALRSAAEERRELLAGGDAGLRLRKVQAEGDAAAMAEEVTGGLRRTRQVREQLGSSGVRSMLAPTPPVSNLFAIGGSRFTQSEAANSLGLASRSPCDLALCLGTGARRGAGAHERHAGSHGDVAHGAGPHARRVPGAAPPPAPEPRPAGHAQLAGQVGERRAG